MSEILTGEGVLLDARPVGFPSRALAGLIDLVSYVAVFFLITAIFSDQLTMSFAMIRAFAIATIAFFTLILPTTIETLTRGASLGKWACGIRVVRDDGGPILFRQAFTRALTGIFELWLSLSAIAMIASVSNARGKRIGDVLAGTFVIRVRAPAEVRATIVSSPALAAWARGADIPRLPDELALAARQFLARAAGMSSQGRARMGGALAEELLTRVAPPPPVCHPEDLIAAVVAERRDREYSKAVSRREFIAGRVNQMARLPFEVGKH